MEINSPQFKDGLIRLLELFPVDVQSQLRAVCTWWKLHIEQQVWCKVNRIDIKHIKSDDDDKYNVRFYNNCVVSSNNVSALKRFITNDHIPGVISLELKFYNCYSKNVPNERLLCHCLKQWSGNLSNLSLALFAETSHEFQSATWTQIELMKQLKSLRLFLPSMRTTEDCAWPVPENLSILANLQKLTLDTSYSENCEIGALTHLGHNLRHLKLHLSSENVQTFKSIVPKLISLEDLSIAIPSFSEPYLLDLLTSLARLNRFDKLCLKNVDWDQLLSLITTHSKDLPKFTLIYNLQMTMSNYNRLANPRHYMDQFDQHFFTCVPIMFPVLEQIDVKLICRKKDREFDERIKRKFADLRNKISKYAKFMLLQDIRSAQNIINFPNGPVFKIARIPFVSSPISIEIRSHGIDQTILPSNSKSLGS